MNKLNLIGTAAAGCMALVFSIPAQAQSGCVKEVFHKYCLGDSIQSVLNKQKPTRTAQENGATNYYFSDAGEQTVVAAFEGRIATVMRTYHPPTQATVDRLRGELKGLYGEPKVNSNAKGRVSEVWNQGTWRVNLMSNIGREVRLTYQHASLQQARSKTKGYHSTEGF